MQEKILARYLQWGRAGVKLTQEWASLYCLTRTMPSQLLHVRIREEEEEESPPVNIEIMLESLPDIFPGYSL